MDRGYPRALRQTLRTTAAAYGYTLTIATTITVLSSVHGKPQSGDLVPVDTDVAWLLAPLAATAVYMLVVAMQVRVVAGRD